jgi:hypothetical protein
VTVERPRALGIPVGAASALAAAHAAHAAQTGTGERTTRASRRIAADPTSTALLLAGPTAMELWPGVRRVGDAGGRVLVEAELPSVASPTSAAVRALPPRRTPTSFVTRFEWAGPGLPLTAGELTLAYAPGADGTPSTFAALEACALQSMAEAFLDNLALAAEQRSSAA